MTLTVADLKAALDRLPDTAKLLVENTGAAGFGEKYDVVRIWPIGAATDDPGLVLQVRRHW